jgi:hypothetical protein
LGRSNLYFEKSTPSALVGLEKIGVKAFRNSV